MYINSMLKFVNLLIILPLNKQKSIMGKKPLEPRNLIPNIRKQLQVNIIKIKFKINFKKFPRGIKA